MFLFLTPIFITSVNSDAYFSQSLGSGQTSSNMHGEIIECALDLLCNYDTTIGRDFSDIADYIKNTQFTYKGNQRSVYWILRDAQRHADDPNDDGYASFLETRHHFWDPYYMSGMSLSISAIEYARRRFCDALDYYNDGDMANAFLYFGWALHLVQDVTVPYHCAPNQELAGCTPTSGPWMHTAYENLVNYRWAEYDPINPSAKWNAILTNQVVNYTAKAYFNGIELDAGESAYFHTMGWVHNAAIEGWKHRENLTSNLPTINSYSVITGSVPSQWDFAVNKLVPYCVSLTAGFLVYIWQYIDTATNDLLGDNIIYDDLDNDGLTIYDEALNGIVLYDNTNYTNPDTDYDGMDDGYEVVYDLKPYLDDTNEDHDHDDLINIDEYYWNSNPRNDDTDDDNLDDGLESDYWVSHGYPMGSDSDNDGTTNLNEVDSDNDGFNDYVEIMDYSTDPGDFYDNPDRWVPNSVVGFTGIPNGYTKINFVWSQPTNYQPGWYYMIWRKLASGGTYTYLTLTFNKYYQDIPPNRYTLYTYRIACYNLYGYLGPYSYWTGKATTSGGGGGGG